ncbi:hypothetical protein G7Y29_04595 [Corynebacterium qintianiae]|uniref:Uncharacterized protein n=1 Tax=Corynebacterium qintianiae TaxID=2709392 RepID=A0A7T0PGN8_9CORY|nr:hypothetical protein [Corynebacterium qintianiae]QPK84062.1 hypothetical protein G7Y29_04595 [Corynebacterium qintianiae]
MKVKTKALSSTTTGFGVALITTAAMWLPTAHAPAQTKSLYPDSAFTRYWSGLGLKQQTATSTPKTAKKPEVSPAFLVKSLQNISGLTAKELGHVFNVSRRSIHNWANGSSISVSNAQRIRAFHALVSSLGVNSPEQRRTLLLSSTGGKSLVEQFIAEGRQGYQLQHTLPVMERLG